MVNCFVCGKNPATEDYLRGYMPCLECQERRRKNKLPDPSEMVGEHVLKERQEYAKSIIQPFNSQGEFSAEYFDAHGTKGVKVTAEQVKNRKHIWDKTISRNVDISKTK